MSTYKRVAKFVHKYVSVVRILKETDTVPELTICQSDSNTSRQTRVVFSTARKLLQNKLLDFHKELLNEIDVDSMVTCLNVLLQFNSFHINQIKRNCHLI